MKKYTNLYVSIPFLIDNRDVDNVLDNDWEMDQNGNIYTTIMTPRGYVRITLGRMIAGFYHNIGEDECIKYKNGDTRDNRLENLEVVKKETVLTPAPAPAPTGNAQLPKYVYLRNGKFCIYNKVNGRSVYVTRVDTLEEAIAKRTEIEAENANQKPLKGKGKKA